MFRILKSDISGGYAKIANVNQIMTLEFFEGVSLSEIIQDKAAIPFPTFFDIALNIVNAVGNIHHSNIIHKEILPENIICNLDNNEIRFIDFSNATEPQKKR